MHLPAFCLCLVIFFALGLRIGWLGQLLALLIASVLVCFCAFLFVSWSDPRYSLHLLLVAAAFDAAIQIGFIVGLFTATRPSAVPLRRSRRAAKAQLERAELLRKDQPREPN